MWRNPTNPFSHFLHKFLRARPVAAQAGSWPRGTGGWDVPIVLSGAGLGEASFAPVLLEGAFCAEVYWRNVPMRDQPSEPQVRASPGTS